VTLNERVDGELRPLAQPAMQYLRPTPITEQYGPLNYGVATDATRWKCTRRSRTLVGTATAPDGTVQRGSYTVRTPSCANRLTLRVRRGRATVADTWRQGGVAPRLCTPKRCVRVSLHSGAASATRRMRIGRGDAVRLETPYQNLVRRVGSRASGGATILTTGDSMMQSLDAILHDRLGASSDVESDVRPGAALASVFAYDWLAVAKQQVAKLHPQATVIFLGMNDLYPIDQDGTKIPCCGPDWSAAYEARAHQAMETYAQGGAGMVIWLTVPMARDVRRNPGERAVNAALLDAASTVPGVYVLPADKIFTPDGKYRRNMTYHGRSVRVREPDGAHLTIPGARIASDYVISALKKYGLVRP
jgi:hypothetical protein